MNNTINTPIEDLVAVLVEEKRNEVDALLNLRNLDISVDSDDSVVITPTSTNGRYFITAVKGGEEWPHEAMPIRVTQEDRPFSQLWGRLGGSIPSFFPKNEISPGPLASLLEDRRRLHLRDLAKRTRRGGDSFLFRSEKKGNMLSLYAVLSDQYSIFDNLQVAVTLQDMLNRLDDGYRIPVLPRQIKDSREYMSIPVIVAYKDVGDGNYGGGFSVINGQTGGSSVRVNPFVMRTSCTNSIRYQHKDAIRFMHRFTSPLTIASGLTDAIGQALQISEHIIRRAVEAYVQTLPRNDFNDIVNAFCKKHDFDPLSVMDGAEGQVSVGGLSNLVTAAARDVRLNGGDEMKAQELEHIGGRILLETEELSGAELARGLFAMVNANFALLEEEGL